MELTVQIYKLCKSFLMVLLNRPLTLFLTHRIGGTYIPQCFPFANFVLSYLSQRNFSIVRRVILNWGVQTAASWVAFKDWCTCRILTYVNNSIRHGLVLVLLALLFWLACVCEPHYPYFPYC